MRKINTFECFVNSQQAERYWITFDGKTASGEMVGVELSMIQGDSRWNNGGRTWHVDVITDKDGVQRGKYNPQTKRGGCGYVVRPERMLKATLENAIRLLDMASAMAFGTKRFSDAQVDMLATVVRLPRMCDANSVDGRQARTMRKLLDCGLIRMVPGEHSRDGLPVHMWLEPTAENLD